LLHKILHGWRHGEAQGVYREIENIVLALVSSVKACHASSPTTKVKSIQTDVITIIKGLRPYSRRELAELRIHRTLQTLKLSYRQCSMLTH
jgi:hypothetical protein